MTGCERDDHDASAVRAYLGRTDDRRFGVVAAFHQHVGPQLGDELERRVVCELDDRVDHLQGRENIAPFGRRSHGPLWTLQSPNGVVAVDADDESVTFTSRREQHVDVSGVKQVEDTVREHDPTAPRLSPRARACPRHDFRVRVFGKTQNRASARG